MTVKRFRWVRELFVYDYRFSTRNRAVCGRGWFVALLLEGGNGIGSALSVRRVSLGAVANMTILDLLRRFPDRSRGVLKQTLLLIRLQHAEEIAGLRVVVIVILAEVELRCIPIDGQWRLSKVRLLLPLPWPFGS